MVSDHVLARSRYERRQTSYKLLWRHDQRHRAVTDAATRWHAWVAIVNPFSALTTDAPHVYLTKDLFFSGHTASTFLLYLCCRGQRTLGAVALAAHVLTVAVVFMAHLHYTIDVIGAWAVTFALYTFCSRRVAGPVLASGPCGPSSV